MADKVIPSLEEILSKQSLVLGPEMAESPSSITLDYDMFSIFRDNVDPIKVAVELQSEIVLEEDMFHQWRDYSYLRYIDQTAKT